MSKSNEEEGGREDGETGDFNRGEGRSEQVLTN